MTGNIKTARLEIHPYREGDRTDLAALLTNSEIKKMYMIPDFETEEAVNAMVEKLRKISFSDDHFERGIYLNEFLIGFVSDVQIDNQEIEIGYVIHPAFQNAGYATEMLKSVIAELFQNGYSTVAACAFAENTASVRVMQKCGMKKMGKETDLSYQGVMHRCVYYAASKGSE